MKRVILIAALLLAFSISTNAQIVVATNNQQVQPTRTTTFNSRPLGHLLRLEAGWPCSIGYGYQFNQNMMFGFGISYVNGGEGVLPVDGHSNIPLYGEIRFNTSNYPLSCYFDARVCVNLNYPAYGNGSPFGFSGQVGVLYKTFSLGLGVGFVDEGRTSYGEYGYGASDLVYLAISIGLDIPISKF